MTKFYQQIQLTNTDIGAVAVDTALPLGTITRRINAAAPSCTTFQLTGGADTLTLTDPGFYKVTYSANVVAGAVGDLTLSLVSNGTTLYTVTETVAEGDTYNLTLPYTLRVYSNCCTVTPAEVQIILGGVAITGTSGNLIVEKIA